MIDCPNGDIRDLLPDLLHDRLPPAQRSEVERHVASCDACSEELSLLRDLRGTMARVPKVDVAAIAAAVPAYRAPSRRSWVGWRAAAAIMMIAAGGTSVAILNHQGTSGGEISAVRTTPTNVRSEATPTLPSVPVATPAPNTGAVVERTPERASERATGTATNVAEPSIAMASGAVTELSDRELSRLIDEIETLDVLPSADVETASGILPAISPDQSHE